MKQNLFQMPFSSLYPLYLQKAERKKRTKEEVDTIICWLTGYDEKGLNQQIEKGTDLETFFQEAPCFHPAASQIKGVICGVRCLDKLIDELAKGKSMDKILRKAAR